MGWNGFKGCVCVDSGEDPESRIAWLKERSVSCGERLCSIVQEGNVGRSPNPLTRVAVATSGNGRGGGDDGTSVKGSEPTADGGECFAGS